MKITLLCTEESHPVNEYLLGWIAKNSHKHQISLVRQRKDLPGGDILFMISCAEIINAEDREKYEVSLVLHASDLPHGRGWSPHVWQVIEGAEELTLSLLEARDQVDSGPIWKKIPIHIPKNALWNEINALLFEAEIRLLDYAVQEFGKLTPEQQIESNNATYYRRRTPEDSRVDPEKTIVEQFDLLRVCDPDRYPAFFELHGSRYKIILEKIDD